MISEPKWRQAIADRAGQCAICGRQITVGQSVGFQKRGDYTGTGPQWIRAHDSCIPAQERTQMALTGVVASNPVTKALESLEEKDEAVTALLGIADSLNRISKALEAQTHYLEAIEFLMRR